MNRIILTLTAIFVFMACENKIAIPPRSSGDCLKVSGFFSAYSDFFNKNNVFILKGIINERILDNYGLRIRVNEDFKGNFHNQENMILWQSLESSDFLHSFSASDEVIIISEKREWEDNNNNTHKDYFTINCYHSILKLSGGVVTGGIFADSYFPTDTISYEDFLLELSNINFVE